jgi:membrane-bound metal-dependent hydrolase YbcI (DUF457 family)
VDVRCEMRGSTGLAWPVLAGLGSHIILDIFSGGVSAFWPWPGRITLGRVKTGSALDTITGAACLVLFVTILVWRML